MPVSRNDGMLDSAMMQSPKSCLSLSFAMKFALSNGLTRPAGAMWLSNGCRACDNNLEVTSVLGVRCLGAAAFCVSHPTLEKERKSLF